MSDPSGAPELSPRLAELAQPGLRRLPPAAQARELGVAIDGPGSLLRIGGRVLVDVQFSQGAISALDELAEAGARVVAPSRRYQTVTVAVAPGRLHGLTGVAGVESVSENRAPLVLGVGAECEGGAVISEGVDQLNAAVARSKHGVDGAGITVGVLSDSYDRAAAAADESGPVATHAAEDTASADLPGAANPCPAEKAPVEVIGDYPGGGASDEGRGMLQIVHDVAPGAELAFATAFLGEIPFAQNIEALADGGPGGAGADVIVDDVIYFEEPFFQDGPIAAAVDKVAADGVAYFSAAGNNNLFQGGEEIASWEAPAFRPSGSCPTAVQALPGIGTGDCMDFETGPEAPDRTFGITVSPGATLTVDLQWAEPWEGVETDLDAYLLDDTGKLVAEEDRNNLGFEVEGFTRKRPVEILQWENDAGVSQTVRLVINRCAGACNPDASETATPVVKFALLQNGGGVTATEYRDGLSSDTFGPTIFGHAAASGAIALGAVPYDNAGQVEKYSSRGPVTHHFEPAVDDEPADPLPSPETIAKPDLVATDCGATTFFSFLAGDGEWRFCGTSAAAPHAAAVAALQLEAEPAATPETIRAAQASTARPVGLFEPKATGAGLLDADAAVAAMLPSATVTITEHPASRTAEGAPTFGFESNPPAGGEFACSIDGAAAEPCDSGLFTTPTPLADGLHLFEVERIDDPGTASFAFTVDTAAPTIAFAQKPAPVSANPKPSFVFAPNEPASLTCAIDGGAPKPCKSPQPVAQALADGPHSFTVGATDQVGNSGTATVDFTVETTPQQPPPLPVGDSAPDTRPPQTSFGKRPAALLRTRKRAVRIAFRFSSDAPGATFECQVDRGAMGPCGIRLSRRFGLGRHVVRVRSRDELGNLDPTPAVFRFRVQRVR